MIGIALTFLGARIIDFGHWIHEVLVLHEGNGATPP